MVKYVKLHKCELKEDGLCKEKEAKDNPKDGRDMHKVMRFLESMQKVIASGEQRQPPLRGGHFEQCGGGSNRK